MPALEAVFGSTGAGEVAMALDHVRSVPSCGITRTVELNRTCCGTVCDNGRLLLDIVALHPDNHPKDAESLLRAIATDHALRIAPALRDAGLLLDSEGDAPRRRDPPALVH